MTFFPERIFFTSSICSRWKQRSNEWANDWSSFYGHYDENLFFFCSLTFHLYKLVFLYLFFTLRVSFRFVATLKSSIRLLFLFDDIIFPLGSFRCILGARNFWPNYYTVRSRTTYNHVILQKSSIVIQIIPVMIYDDQ